MSRRRWILVGVLFLAGILSQVFFEHGERAPIATLLWGAGGVILIASHGRSQR